MRTATQALFLLLGLPGLARPDAETLLMDLSAKSQAQASAMGAGGQGLSQLRHNPSSLSRLSRFEMLFTHVDSFGEWSQDYLVLGAPYAVGTLGLELQWSRMKPFPYYDELGREAGSLEAGSQLLGLAWAQRSLGGFLGLGLSYKIFQAQLSEYRNWGYAFDLGVDARSRDGLLSGALALLHAGEQSAFYATREDLPLALQWSLALEGSPARNLALRLGADGLHFRSPYRPVEIRLGGQARAFEMLQLRAGLRMQALLWRPSFGAGIALSFGELSYAFLPDNLLGSTHTVTLEWRARAAK